MADYNRQFVKEGTIRIDNHDMYAFLFSDALLICRYPKKGPEDKFVGKRLIPLNMAVLKDIEDTEGTAACATYLDSPLNSPLALLTG